MLSNNLARNKAIEECPSYSVCGAPICPLDPEKDIGIWFPDDEICRTNHSPEWVNIQKKIKKKSLNTDTFYNLKMLMLNCIIGKRFYGINPDKDYSIQISKWFMDHRPKRVLTEEEKEILRKSFKKKISGPTKGSIRQGY